MITESELKAVRMALSRIHGFSASEGVSYNRIKDGKVRTAIVRSDRRPLDGLNDFVFKVAK